MTVKSVKEAWTKANVIFPTDYTKDDVRSERAGYNIYYSTCDGVNAWISDLGNRLEVNLEDGSTVNIWIKEEPTFAEYQIADALKVISEALYEIDDKVSSKLKDEIGLTDVRDQMYGMYAKLTKILKEDYPESKLFAHYNLKK